VAQAANGEPMPRHPRLRQRGRKRIWYATVYDAAGERFELSTHCTTEEAARLRLKELEREYAVSRGHPAHEAPYPLTVALADLEDTGCQGLAAKTVVMYHSRGNQLFTGLGDVDVNSLARAQVAQYIAGRQRAGASDHTVFKELVCLRRALKHAKDQGFFRGVVADLFPSFSPNYKPRERWLTPEEFDLLLSVILTDAHRVWLMVAVYTGCRAGEVRGLKWEHLNWERNWIEVYGTKTEGAERGIPLHPVLKAFLWSRRLDGQGKERTGPICARWHRIYRDLAAACARAEDKVRRFHQSEGRREQAEAFRFPKVTPNDLRRTMASWLGQDGVSERVIADLLGHARTVMVRQVYSKMSDPALTAGLGKLPAPKLEALHPTVPAKPKRRTRKPHAATVPQTKGKNRV